MQSFQALSVVFDFFGLPSAIFHLPSPLVTGTISAPFLHHFLHFQFVISLIINDLRQKIAPSAFSGVAPCAWSPTQIDQPAKPLQTLGCHGITLVSRL